MAWLLETLPVALRDKLVQGGEGAGHLRACAALARTLGLADLAERLTLAAWVDSPLDASLATDVLALEPEAASDWASPPSTAGDQPREAAALAASRELARFVAVNTAPPADLAYYQRLAARRDAPKIASYLASQRARQPGNLFWERLELTHALDLGDWERACRVTAGLPEPLARLLGGDAAMYAGQPARAMADYARCARQWPVPGIEARLGFAALAMGDSQEAGRWLRQAMLREPWRAEPLLAASDLAWGTAGQRARPEGRVAVLLYTYNKADEIGRTLLSLAQGDLEGVRIVALDNGSPDATPEVLAAWRERLGPDVLEVVRLPVNVGAPAARNWLASLPVARASDWAVFLDDDVRLPADWLGRLGAAAALYPSAGVWGARVVEEARPWRIQSAAVFLDVPDTAPASADLGRAFELSSLHHQTLDRGQFANLRPCATVTGCCHLFRTSVLRELGGFDLRYSPSQYDDLDHDIRLLLSGRTPVCQGHLTVLHAKSTGSLGGEGQSQWGLGFANQYKLHRKFDHASFSRAARLAQESAWRDLQNKRRALESG